MADDSELKRERSTIDFPYLDLEDAVGMAKGIHAVGGSSCQVDQLAAHLGQAAAGGGFRQRLIVARIFGLVTYERGEISLTELGSRICDPRQERAARVDSFLNVPLYKAVYEKFRGTVLPPSAGLEATMVSLGVAPKQKDKARQTFARTAKQAGFFDFGNDRLVIPPLKDGPSPIEAPPKPESNGSKGSEHRSVDIPELHPFICGLLGKLPQHESVWPIEERRRWLQTAANIFDLMFKPADDEAAKQITIQVS